MIRVIRTDGMEILLNSALIEDLGMTPENTTVVTLGTGEQIYVKNTPADILQKIDAYRYGMAEARREEDRERKKKEELEKEKEREKDREKEREKEREIEREKQNEQEPEQETEPDLEQEQNQGA